jgi:hypothetical protein
VHSSYNSLPQTSLDASVLLERDGDRQVIPWISGGFRGPPTGEADITHRLLVFCKILANCVCREKREGGGGVERGVLYSIALHRLHDSLLVTFAGRRKRIAMFCSYFVTKSSRTPLSYVLLNFFEEQTCGLGNKVL